MKKDTDVIDEAYTRLTKLNEMRQFYLYQQKQDMIKTIDSMIAECYSIIEEQEEIRYFDTFVGRKTGVVLDNFKKSDNDTETKAQRPKRQIRAGSPLQRGADRKSAFDGLTETSVSESDRKN